MKSIEVKFLVLKIVDSRKTGSLLEIGKEYIGYLNPVNNCIFWEDVGSSQDCFFYVDDTATITEYITKDKAARQHQIYQELKKEHEYWGNNDLNELLDFTWRNNLLNPLHDLRQIKNQ